MKKTLLTLPEDLLGKVRELSEAPTKSQAVIVALKDYLRGKRLHRLMKRMGKGFGLTLEDLLESRKAG